MWVRKAPISPPHVTSFSVRLPKSLHVLALLQRLVSTQVRLFSHVRPHKSSLKPLKSPILHFIHLSHLHPDPPCPIPSPPLRLTRPPIAPGEGPADQLRRLVAALGRVQQRRRRLQLPRHGGGAAPPTRSQRYGRVRRREWRWFRT